MKNPKAETRPVGSVPDLIGKESGLASKPRITAPVGSAAETRVLTSVSTLSKNQREKVQRRIKDIEAEIPVLEDDLAKLSAEIASPEVTADYTKLQKVTKKFREKEKQLQDLYNEWEAAANYVN